MNQWACRADDDNFGHNFKLWLRLRMNLCEKWCGKCTQTRPHNNAIRNVFTFNLTRYYIRASSGWILYRKAIRFSFSTALLSNDKKIYKLCLMTFVRKCVSWILNYCQFRCRFLLLLLWLETWSWLFGIFVWCDIQSPEMAARLTDITNVNCTRFCAKSKSTNVAAFWTVVSGWKSFHFSRTNTFFPSLCIRDQYFFSPLCNWNTRANRTHTLFDNGSLL